MRTDPPIFRPRKGETYTQIVRIGRGWRLKRRRRWTVQAVRKDAR